MRGLYLLIYLIGHLRAEIYSSYIPYIHSLVVILYNTFNNFAYKIMNIKNYSHGRSSAAFFTFRDFGEGNSAST